MNYHRLLNEFFRQNYNQPHVRIQQYAWDEMVYKLFETNPDELQSRAKQILDNEKARRERKTSPQMELAEFMGSSGEPVYMVTINYPDKFTDFAFMQEIVDRIREKDWVKKHEFVHEYHTEQGNHPHTHMIMTCHKKFTPRRLAETIFSTKNLKKYCEALNFVQVEKDTHRSWIDRHDYIVGNKKESKVHLLELDRRWREENNIPELEPRA